LFGDGTAEDGGSPGLDPDAEIEPHSFPACSNDADCENPPSTCYLSDGRCDNETCVYEPLPAGTVCSHKDPCRVDATCDGEGSCTGGKEMDCSAPNTTQGTCREGACTGYVCTPGWDDCNGYWDDGCESQLASDPKHCGTCLRACPEPPNTVATCEDGKCGFRCAPPYEDCNGDPSDGCEIPAGRPNSCDRQGLTEFTTAAKATPGCGTPYCGPSSSSDKTAESFVTWHCKFCKHCQLFDDGGAWCIGTTGEFSAERCTNCCNPAAPNFPQKCK
jgi:hypothetical protein